MIIKSIEGLCKLYGLNELKFLAFMLNNDIAIMWETVDRYCLYIPTDKGRSYCGCFDTNQNCFLWNASLVDLYHSNLSTLTDSN